MTNPTTDFANDRFVRAPEVRTRYGISNATLYRWVSKGTLPAPAYLNGARVWKQSTLEAAEAQLCKCDPPSVEVPISPNNRRSEVGG